MKRNILLVLCYQRDGGDDRFVRYGEVTADAGKIKPPTPNEMQKMMFAAKAKLARMRYEKATRKKRHTKR